MRRDCLPPPRLCPGRLPQSEDGPTSGLTRTLPALGSARRLRMRRAGEPGLSGGRAAGRAGGDGEGTALWAGRQVGRRS